ncbi:hypothetical protein BHE74_00033410 [Ensete ventricosum]|nr:hypothetical protein BHE74_00033410 [Ensete ventricosum]
MIKPQGFLSIGIRATILGILAAIPLSISAATSPSRSYSLAVIFTQSSHCSYRPWSCYHTSLVAATLLQFLTIFAATIISQKKKEREEEEGRAPQPWHMSASSAACSCTNFISSSATKKITSSLACGSSTVVPGPLLVQRCQRVFIPLRQDLASLHRCHLCFNPSLPSCSTVTVVAISLLLPIRNRWSPATITAALPLQPHLPPPTAVTSPPTVAVGYRCPISQSHE